MTNYELSAHPVLPNVSDFELSVLPFSVNESNHELSAHPVFPNQSNYGLPVQFSQMCLFLNCFSTSSVNASKFEFFFCPVTAKEAINELSTVSVASKETINELSVPYTFLGPYVHCFSSFEVSVSAFGFLIRLLHRGDLLLHLLLHGCLLSCSGGLLFRYGSLLLCLLLLGDILRRQLLCVCLLLHPAYLLCLGFLLRLSTLLLHFLLDLVLNCKHLLLTTSLVSHYKNSTTITLLVTEFCIALLWFLSLRVSVFACLCVLIPWVFSCLWLLCFLPWP